MISFLHIFGRPGGGTLGKRTLTNRNYIDDQAMKVPFLNATGEK